MNTSLFIAWRYARFKSGSHAVNILARIALGGVAVGTAALIVVLSAFNGLELLIRDLYNTFDPDIKISAQRGKFFVPEQEQLNELKNLDFIEAYTLAMEERALMRHQDEEHIVSLKGVDEQFTLVTRFEKSLIRGHYFSADDEVVLGLGVAYYLSAGVGDEASELQIFAPKAGVKLNSKPENAFKQIWVMPVGIFSIQPEFDQKFVLMSLQTLQLATGHTDAVSDIEIKLAKGTSDKKAKKALAQIFDENEFKIKNRDEQQEAFFKVLKSEGLVVYLVFTFIIVIAAFSLMGALRMLILDKRQDAFTLAAMGFTDEKLRQTYLVNGLITSLFGAVIGMTLGIGIVLLQMQFGFVSLGSGYLVDAYPMHLKITDVLLIFTTVITIGSLVSLLSTLGIKGFLTHRNKR